MPEPNQYTLTHKELVELVIKASHIHEGRWWLLLNFGMGPGNFGPTENQVNPGMVVVVNSIGIQREIPGTPTPSPLVVDAAEVNPEEKAASPEAPRSRKPKP
jgi:hypothetical protein